MRGDARQYVAQVAEGFDVMALAVVGQVRREMYAVPAGASPGPARVVPAG